MVKSMSITKIAGQMYELLEPLSSEDRQKCIKATLVFLGEEIAAGSKQAPVQKAESTVNGSHRQVVDVRRDLGEKLRRWMVKHQIEQSFLDNLFHIEDEVVELIADSVPGRSKKDKTINCYLLVGIKNLIQNDEAKFQDKEALEFCQRTLSYDKNNHTTHRQALSSRASGDRSSGFSLTVPGLRDAAKLVKEMSEGE